VPSTPKGEPWNKGSQNRLAALGEKKPERKAAQIRALWSEIHVARERGHSLKTICDCLEAEGIQISVTTLGSYITRMRRKEASREAASREIANPYAAGSVTESRRSPLPARDLIVSEPGQPRDPLLNLRKHDERVFDYRPELADPEKLI
jgi:hypothetical protein